MGKSIFNATAILFLFLFLYVHDAQAAAFPGAVGFGSGAKGGRGGKVIAVTNLNDSGVGSFRAALTTTGPRIIIFTVSGTINLNSNLLVPLNNGNVTIAAQTSPGGIQIARAPLTIKGSNVIVRGLMMRPGDAAGGADYGNRDALQIENDTGTGVSNVIVDHCDMMWSTDEILSLYYAGTTDITLSNNIMSEPLYNSYNPQTPHSMGPLLGAGCSRVTMYGNILSNNAERNPKSFCNQLEFINNVTYNRMNHLIRVASSGGLASTANIISNVFMRGPNWTGTWPIVMTLTSDISSGASVYLSDNNLTTYTCPWYTPGSTFITDKPAFTGSGIVAMPVARVKDWVAANVGARPWARDVQEQRLVNQIVNQAGGKLIDTPSQVGGYPTLSGSAATDTDGDGIPDWWEDSHGLNKNNAADAALDRNQDGWSNIEEYINSFYDMTAGSSTGLTAPTLRILSQN